MIDRILVARILFTLMTAGWALLTVFADFNKTHATNPKWTPHARFHVVWQISSYVGLGLLAFALIWWPGPMAVERLYLVAVMGALVYAAWSSWWSLFAALLIFVVVVSGGFLGWWWFRWRRAPVAAPETISEPSRSTAEARSRIGAPCRYRAPSGGLNRRTNGGILVPPPLASWMLTTALLSDPMV